MTQLEGTACLLFSSLPCLREHMLHCTSIAGPTDNIPSRWRAPLHACLLQASKHVGFVSRLQSRATFLLVGVVYCCHHVHLFLQQHHGDNLFICGSDACEQDDAIGMEPLLQPRNLTVTPEYVCGVNGFDVVPSSMCVSTIHCFPALTRSLL